MPRQTQAERDKLIAKKLQLEARIKNLDAREKTQKRKAETRAKIIYGSLAMEHAATNPDSEFAAIMRRLLNRYVIRPAERELLGLPERDAKDGSTEKSDPDTSTAASPAPPAPFAESA